MHIDESQLSEFLVDSGVLSAESLNEVRKVAGERKIGLGEVAVMKGFLTNEDLRRIQSYLLGLPFVDLKSRPLDFAVLSLIPEPISRHHNVVAFGRGEGGVEVAVLNINDLAHIEFLKRQTLSKVLPRLTDEESMKWALLSYQKSLHTEFGESIHKATRDANYQRIVDSLLKHAIVQHASDIHIEPGEESLMVRYRIGGILREALILPKSVATGVVKQVKAIANMKIEVTTLPQDGRFKITLAHERIGFKVATLPTRTGEKVAMRVLREGASGFALESLGFHGTQLETLHKTLHHSGLVVVSGEAKSGRTTTLYTMLDILNTPHLNIATVEEPVEYHMPRLNQTEVNAKAGLTYESALRAVARQDADVIMVGEVKGAEVATLCMSNALSHRLVLASTTASSALGTLEQLLNMKKVEPTLLANSLKAIVNQKLLKRLPEVKQKYHLSKTELKSLGNLVDLDRMLELLKRENIVSVRETWETVPFYKPGKGAPKNEGEIVVSEVLAMTPTVKDLIANGATAKQVVEQAKRESFTTLLEDAVLKAVQGLISLEEVLNLRK